jgi:hypothetical protein
MQKAMSLCLQGKVQLKAAARSPGPLFAELLPFKINKTLRKAAAT